MDPAAVDRGGAIGEVLALIRERFPGIPAAAGRPTAAHVRLAVEQLPGVLALLRHHPSLDFDQLIDLTAVDLSGVSGDHPFDLVYQLRSLGRAHRLQVTAEVGQPDASLPSAGEHWPGARWLEREVHEMLGLRFAGPGRAERLLTPAHFNGHPLLRGFALTGDGGERQAAADGEPEPGPAGSLLELPAGVGRGPVPLRVRLHLDDEQVVEAEVEPGLAHSGFEKLAEHLGYHQLATAAERVTDADPASGALAAVLAAECLLQVEVPPRARRIRLVLAELSRLHSHIEWLARLARVAGFGQAAALADGGAEAAADLQQLLSGRRRIPGVLRVGGVAADLPEAMPSAMTEFLEGLRRSLGRLRVLWVGTRSWDRRARGLGALAPDRAIAWGVTGPDLRATGVCEDARRSLPYCGYEEVDFEVPVGAAGDAFDRCAVRLAEIEQSARILETACRDLPGGPVMIDDYEVSQPPPGGAGTHVEELIHHMELWMDGHGLRPPPGSQVYQPVEGATGELGIFVLSDGTGRPYRLHLRSPSLMQAQVLADLLRGVHLEDAPVVVASLGICAAEMDR